MITKEEWEKAFVKMRSVAREAIEIADRCHGGHSYESLRSTAGKKCCEVRMQVDDLKLEFVKLSQGMESRELSKRRKR